MKIIKVGAVWCPSCIVTNKFWKEIKKEYQNIEFVDLDIDMDEDKIKDLNIGNILPEIIIFNNDEKEVERLVGEKNKTEIEKIIGEYNEVK